MIHQLTLTGQELADVGTALALDAQPSWRQQADVWIMAQRGPFTSEDLTAAIGLPTSVVGKDRNNAVGALFRTYAKRGSIIAIGARSAQRPASHGALLRVWQRATIREEQAA